MPTFVDDVHVQGAATISGDVAATTQILTLAAGQTQPFIEFQNESGTTLSAISITGEATGALASQFDPAGSASTAAAQAQANAEAASLPLAGGTMSGPIAMGSNQITGLANATTATDAATFGQIPTTLPPSGAAGGVLSGSYPNPGLSTAAEAIPNGWTATTQAPLDNSTKLATTAYTDAAVATALTTIPAQPSCVYATAAALPTNTYANGTSGVGATLTASADAALTVDGQSVSVGDRILVQNEATAANNGIYTVTNAGSSTSLWVLTRATDFDTGTEMGTTMLIPVDSGSLPAGSTNNGKIYLSITSSPFTVGTTSITFTQVGGTYVAGTNMALSGNQFSVANSPAFTGTPTVPTAAVGTDTTQIASTAFVIGQAGGATPVMDGTATAGVSTSFSRQDHVHPTDTSRAPLASPALTGTPTVPTAAAGTNTTQIASTAFVETAVSSYVPLTQVAAASGVASLDATGNVPATQLNNIVPNAIAGGTLGTTYALTLSKVNPQWLFGVLAANLDVTIATLVAGASAKLLLTQNSTGGFTLSVNSAPVEIPTGANTSVVVDIETDGTNLWVTPQGGPSLLAQYVPLLENVNTVTTSGTAQTIPPPQTATMNRIVLSANCTLTFPTAVLGGSFTLQVNQPASGGPFSVIWPTTALVWVAGSAPTQATGASKRDLYSFMCIDGSSWLGIQVSRAGGF